jgi:hypothetical protein
MSRRGDQQLKVLAACDAATRKLKLTGSTGAVKARQRIEQTIALTAAQALLDAGYTLGVNDGEEVTIHHSKDLDAIQAALFTTDEDYLYVYRHSAGHIYSDLRGEKHEDTRPDFWVRLVYGNDGWDVISDYSIALEKFIGDDTVVVKLITYAEENGVVPDLHNRKS